MHTPNQRLILASIAGVAAAWAFAFAAIIIAPDAAWDNATAVSLIGMAVAGVSGALVERNRAPSTNVPPGLD